MPLAKRFTPHPDPAAPERAEPYPLRTDAPGLAAPVRWYGRTGVHLVALAGLAGWFLAMSWRRWPDPVVDFGRELYVPWRLAEGAVLYRDFDHLYGPLSQYLNALLFRAFGPGLMVLVWANLAVFAAIITLTYLLLRRAWGAGAAVAGGSVFIVVFGFARFLFVGNYNYVTPYAHETTHGMLVLLLLAAVLIRGGRQPSAVLAAAGGFLFGLTLVLKPEIALAAGALVVAAVAIRWRHAAGGTWREGAWAAAMAAVPTIGFTVFFYGELALAESWAAACRGWLNVVGTSRHVMSQAQLEYTGLNAPWANLRQHVVAVAGAVALLALMAGAARLLERRSVTRGTAALGGGVALALGLASLGWSAERWTYVGQCLLGLLGIYLVRRLRDFRRNLAAAGWPRERAVTRLLLAVLAASLMARMILAGRIYHFGYYQAALAAVVVVAVLVGEFPAAVAATRPGRAWLRVWVLAMLIPAVAALGWRGMRLYRHMDSPVGRARDQFFTFRAAAPVAGVAALLEKAPPGRTLLVLPEGLMLNYLARMPDPIPQSYLYAAVTAGGEEARIVGRLDARPPDLIVTLPRDLRESGIENYGEVSGSGGDLFAWMRNRYELHAWVRGDDYKGPAPAPEVVAYTKSYVQVFGPKQAIDTGGAPAVR